MDIQACPKQSRVSCQRWPCAHEMIRPFLVYQPSEVDNPQALRRSAIALLRRVAPVIGCQEGDHAHWLLRPITSHNLGDSSRVGDRCVQTLSAKSRQTVWSQRHYDFMIQGEGPFGSKTLDQQM